MKSVIFKDKRKLPALLWRCLLWHLNYYFKKTTKPIACGLYITNRCNYRCDFCNIWRKPASATLPFEKAQAIVDNLSGLGCYYFSITGGEPLLVDYIFDLLRYVRQSRIKYIHMVTNGYFLDRAKAARLKESGIDEISISIDGAEEIHDNRRGIKGAYRKALEAIGNMKNQAPKVNIVLNAILFPDKPYECLHTLELARKFGLWLKIQPFNRHPVFNQNNHSLMPLEPLQGPDEKGIREVMETLKSDKRTVNSRAFLENIYNFYFRPDRLLFKDEDCLFGYHHLEILENSRVFPCLEGLGWEKGFEFEGDLESAISSKEYNLLLEGLRKCKGCSKNYYICYYEPRINFPVSNFLRFRR